MSNEAFEPYRKQVQSQIQDLMAGNRPRNPDLACVGTGRLILEGVVEAMKIYRENRMDKKEQGERGKKDRHGGGSREERIHRSRERKKRSGSRDRRRKHYRSKSRTRDESCERHRESSKRRHCRPPGERKRTDDSPDRRDDVLDIAREGFSSDDSRFMMTSGAGQPSTLPYGHHASGHHSEHPDTQPVVSPNSAPRAAAPRQRRSDLPKGNVGASHSPTRPRAGPNRTPLGDVPKYKLKKSPALGFVSHAMNTYRHVKAEQEAGLRPKGMFEKHVDDWREKMAGAKPKGSNKLQRRDSSWKHKLPMRDGKNTRVDSARTRGSYRTDGQHFREGGGVTEGNKRQQSDLPPVSSRPSQPLNVPSPTSSPATFSASSHPPSAPVPPTMPPTLQPSHIPAPSPILVTSSSTPPILPPPPANQRTAPITTIRGGTTLREVSLSSQVDHSKAKQAATPTYPATPYSDRVEALEHAQSVEEREEKEQDQGKYSVYKPEVRRLLTYSWFEPGDGARGLE